MKFSISIARWATFLLFLFVSPGFAAEDSSDSEDKEQLGKITVRDHDEAMELERSPMPVSVISAERFHGRNISLNEVLKRVAGVRLAQEGGLGSRATIAVHGLEGKRVKLFIDGNPLNAPDGTFGINDIPIQLIDRIEIYKGVVPARFGGDALGGAVNVVTRDFDGSWSDTTVSLGSYDTQRITGVYTKKWDDLGLEIGVGGFYNHAANDYTMKIPEEFVSQSEGNVYRRRDHDEFESILYATSGKLEDRWFDTIEWELVRYESYKEIQGIRYNIQEAKNESSLNFLGLSFEKTDFLLRGLDFEYDYGRPELTLHNIDNATTCYDFDGSERSCPGINGIGEISGLPADSSDKQTENRHDLNLHYAINRNHGINFHWNSQSSRYEPEDDLVSSVVGYDVGAYPSDRKNSVTSLSYESAFFDDRWVNDIGVKYYEYDYDIASELRSISGIPARNRNSGSESGYYLSTRYSPIRDVYLKASYEEAYRLPDSAEIFGDGISIISSPELNPEQGDNFNLGILFDRFDFVGMPWFKAEATYFSRDIEDMIKLTTVSRASQYVNLGQIGVEGFELELKADISDQWYVFANYTNQELKDEQRYQDGSTAENPTYGLDVPNVPKQMANLGFEHKTTGLWRADSILTLFWETNWVDEFYYGWHLSTLQDRKVDSQLSHTAGFEYSFHDDEITLGFEVRNLTDEDLTDVFNYPLMGRSYHLNLRYVWFK